VRHCTTGHPRRDNDSAVAGVTYTQTLGLGSSTIPKMKNKQAKLEDSTVLNMHLRRLNRELY
jgi:hypothetical protein